MAKKRPRRIKGAKPSDPLVLFLNAKGFDLVARIVDKHPGHKSLLLYPTIANEAFALELYLKCLHRIRRRRGRKVWGHDTKSLFDTLSKADKKTLSKYLLEIVRQHPDYLLMFSKGISFDASAVAQRASATFAKGRYWSDMNLPNGDDDGFVTNAGVGNLCDAIVKLILELRPDWEERLKNFRFRLPGQGLLPT